MNEDYTFIGNAPRMEPKLKFGNPNFTKELQKYLNLLQTLYVNIPVTFHLYYDEIMVKGETFEVCLFVYDTVPRHWGDFDDPRFKESLEQDYLNLLNRRLFAIDLRPDILRELQRLFDIIGVHTGRYEETRQGDFINLSLDDKKAIRWTWVEYLRNINLHTAGSNDENAILLYWDNKMETIVDENNNHLLFCLVPKFTNDPDLLSPNEYPIGWYSMNDVVEQYQWDILKTKAGNYFTLLEEMEKTHAGIVSIRRIVRKRRIQES